MKGNMLPVAPLRTPVRPQPLVAARTRSRPVATWVLERTPQPPTCGNPGGSRGWSSATMGSKLLDMGKKTYDFSLRHPFWLASKMFFHPDETTWSWIHLGLYSSGIRWWNGTLYCQVPRTTNNLHSWVPAEDDFARVQLETFLPLPRGPSWGGNRAVENCNDSARWRCKIMITSTMRYCNILAWWFHMIELLEPTTGTWIEPIKMGIADCWLAVSFK